MALHYDVVNFLRDLREAKQDLELALRKNYKDGAHVSFVNPNNKDGTKYTGVIRQWILDVNDETAVAYIEIDEQFRPLPWGEKTVDSIVRINILNPEYDITIIE